MNMRSPEDQGRLACHAEQNRMRCAIRMPHCNSKAQHSRRAGRRCWAAMTVISRRKASRPERAHQPYTVSQGPLQIDQSLTTHGWDGPGDWLRASLLSRAGVSAQ